MAWAVGVRAQAGLRGGLVVTSEHDDARERDAARRENEAGRGGHVRFLYCNMTSKARRGKPGYIKFMSSIPSKSPAIAWYRSHIPSPELKRLHERSDARGFAQTLGYLGLLVATGAAVLYAAGKIPVSVLLALIFLHGTCFAFQINAVHELGHGTVFKTKALNAFFVRIFAFLRLDQFRDVRPQPHSTPPLYAARARTILKWCCRSRSWCAIFSGRASSTRADSGMPCAAMPGPPPAA